jgi:hypothetical protein
MQRTHAIHSRLGVTAPLALIGALHATQVFAQVPAPPPPVVAPVEAAAPGTAPATADPQSPATADSQSPAADAADTPPAADLATLNARLDAMKKELDAVKAQQSEATAGAAEASAEEFADDRSTGGEPLKIYGFMDMGLNQVWVKKSAPLTKLFQLNNTTFVVGNINLYFDAQPIKHFRGLAEVRFTNAPFGDVVNYGGLAGTFERKDTFSYDSGGTALNAPMWTASVILERAWIEWNEHQAFKFRVGNFFTPFGIWNEDHGTPTLISLGLPQFIVQRWMPIRQTGIMAYGSAFAGDWELGYSGTLSNGRQEISNYNFDNNFGVGGRVYARRDLGQMNTTFGLSYFTGKTKDTSIDVVPSPTAINGLDLVETTTYAYTEHVAGADVSVDIDATRIRAEAVVRRQVFVPGQRSANNALFARGSFLPDSWQQSAYLLVANQLPWFGIEPYVWGEALEIPTIIGDLLMTASVGVNVHFNPSIQWKTQAGRSVSLSWLHTSPYDTSQNNLTTLYSRLVMAF